jgi:hypothetical protein
MELVSINGAARTVVIKDNPRAEVSSPVACPRELRPTLRHGAVFGAKGQFRDQRLNGGAGTIPAATVAPVLLRGPVGRSGGA